MTLTLEFGDELQEALRVPLQEQESRLRLELSMRLYEKGLLTLGKARQLAGKEKWEYLLLLAREGISRQYDEQELERDILTLDTLS